MSSPDPKALKEEFLAQNGKWSPQWESLLNLDPSYFAAYLKLRAAASKGKHVSPKFQELIHLSVASVVSTMFVPGIEAHTRAALDAGATKEEILEVLALTSVCGIHSISCGLPVLMEILSEQGKLPEWPEQLDSKRQQIKDDFHKKRGYWGSTWDKLLAFDPDFLEAYTVSDISSPEIVTNHIKSSAFYRESQALDLKTLTRILCSNFRASLSVKARTISPQRRRSSYIVRSMLVPRTCTRQA
jgi:alkylhydroperoxidase/carboxymuconolactone decarboxylase family protein YurZ